MIKRAKKYTSKDNQVVRTEGNLKKDYTGERRGFFSILKHIGFNHRDKSVYLVEDIFGSQFSVSANAVCQKHFGTRFYVASSIRKCRRINTCYHNMLRRCYDPTTHAYNCYGGKGVKVCDAWLGNDGRINFMIWAVAAGYKEDLTIDRKNSSDDYTPHNCKWVTKKENCRRTTRTKLTLDTVTTIREEFEKVPRDQKRNFFEKYATKHKCTVWAIRSVCYKSSRWVQ